MNARHGIAATTPKPTGIATRTPSYQHWHQIAEGFDGLATNRCQIQVAVAYGTADLTWPARSLLLLLLSHLSPADVACGKTAVWPSTSQIAAAFACSERAVRTYKAELEAKGYLLRRYDRRNRPLRGAAFDLAPFFARLPDILSAVEASASGRRRERLLKRSEREPVIATKAEESFRLRNSQNPTTDSVPVLACNKGDIAAALEIVSLSPTLTAALSHDAMNMLTLGQPERAFQEIGEQIDQFLTDDHGRRNNRATWAWAVRRYGAKAIAMLGIAIEDPDVRCRHRFFGWLTTTADSIDLTPNLRRLQQRLPAPAPETVPPAIPGLCRLLGQTLYQAWFSQCHLILQDTAAVLVAPNRFTADWIRNNFAPELRLFAKNQGYAFLEVTAQPRPAPIAGLQQDTPWADARMSGILPKASNEMASQINRRMP